mmetsp:Transcript_10733/g.16133  ORF Transcript_10733/g.16133 Transcript_10733/m.16133 type:complete len:93 (-) Transcript_10733:46-324(-)
MRSRKKPSFGNGKQLRCLSRKQKNIEIQSIVISAFNTYCPNECMKCSLKKVLLNFLFFTIFIILSKQRMRIKCVKSVVYLYFQCICVCIFVS